MNNKRTSKTNIKLPKISTSPSKAIERVKNKSVKNEDASSKYSATAFAIFDQDMKPVRCIKKVN